MTPYEMKALHATGTSYREIAALAGVAMTTVASYIKGNVAKPRKKQTTERKCMCCSTTFKSYGAHHRLCDRCKRRSVSPYAPHFPE